MRMIVDTAKRTLSMLGESHDCVIGRGGAIAATDKREGDGATPLGLWPLRTALLRPDREFALLPGMPWRWLRPNDGWSDDISDKDYNRPVQHPHRYSAERLWRDDAVYDVIVTLGHNDSPPRANLGSAIFLHCTRPDRRPTEGCVAIDRTVLLALLARFSDGALVEII